MDAKVPVAGLAAIHAEDFVQTHVVQGAKIHVAGLAAIHVVQGATRIVQKHVIECVQSTVVSQHV